LKKILFCLLATAAFSLATSSALPAAHGATMLEQRPSSDANVIVGEYIVVYKRSAESVGAETNARERELGFDSDFRYRHALEGFAGALSPGQVRALRNDPEVAYVTRDRSVQASSLAPVIPGETVPTGPRRIGAGTAAGVEHASGVGVAVIDSGVDLTHPDLNVSHGTNCITPGASADDDDGHGTHVAGTIAAKNNGSGVTGVAPGTKVWAVKVLDSTGSGSFGSIICGLDWVTANATAKDIKVLNMSLGGFGDPVEPCATTTDPLHQAVCRTTAADVLNVVAAGNDGWDFDFELLPDVPAAYPESLTVTALSDSDGQSGGTGGAPSCDPLESDDYPATFSNYAGTPAGEAHTIAAPGVCITSTWPTNLSESGYEVASGTSMASPHVAGVAALCENHGGIAGACAGKTPAQAISTLRSQAQSYTLARPSYGFDFDPVHGPLTGLYFGYLTGVFDTQPPQTSIGVAPSGTTRSTSATFEFSSSEAGSRFECSLDSIGWTPCASPQQVPGLGDGSHTVAVRAVDAAGNVDASPATRTWTVDTTAPDTSITSGPDGETSARSARFELSTTEPGSRLACKLDSGAWAECSSPSDVTGLADGSHTLSVAAIDAVGNVDQTPATRTWTVLPDLKVIESGLSSDLAGMAGALRKFGIAKLVKRGSFTARGIDAPLAGKLSIALDGTPQGKAGVARKAVLAKGARSVSGAGSYALKMKLTRQGKRLLRHDRRAKVTLRIKFRDLFDRVTTTDEALRLRR
jgi:hypothetical protein